ncbi:hypothetical protein [Clostridium manihotivorum]|uniref:Uncharacterized protein n=1 Tax=Clostridium manihotivorum TaxID=2320868 RepID=A0A3R5U6D3_9CLOT|nr:hypothetical protein [Clostridium manihotivorum]QAA32982.1 hypothetical protein C1I91_15790 [Clostridium manihotivorum]
MILNKSIEMVAAFNKDGKVIPVRFRVFSEDESYTVFTVNKILRVDEAKSNMENVILFNCKSTINNIEKDIELKYIKDTCMWYLNKINA